MIPCYQWELKYSEYVKGIKNSSEAVGVIENLHPAIDFIIGWKLNGGAPLSGLINCTLSCTCLSSG